VDSVLDDALSYLVAYVYKYYPEKYARDALHYFLLFEKGEIDYPEYAEKSKIKDNSVCPYTLISLIYLQIFSMNFIAFSYFLLNRT